MTSVVPLVCVGRYTAICAEVTALANPSGLLGVTQSVAPSQGN